MSTQDIHSPMPSPDTNANKEVEEWSKGRATSLFTAAVLSGGTLVLATSYWLTRGGEHGISLKPLCYWEIILFVVAVSAMVLFTCLRSNEKYVVDSIKPFSDAYMDYKFDEKEGNLPFWIFVPLRDIAISACCVGGIVLPIYEAYRVVKNLMCFENKLAEFRLVKCVSNICRAMFCICHLFFVLYNKTKSARYRLLRLLMSTVAVANFTICIDVLMYVIQANDSLDIQSEQNDVVNMSSFNLEEKPVFIECQKNSVKIDFVAEWIYKFTYQFPIEFAVLSFCYFGSIWNVFKPAKLVTRVKRNTETLHIRQIGDNQQEHSVTDPRRQISERQREPSVTSADKDGRSANYKYRFITVGVKGMVRLTSSWAFPLSFTFILGVFVFHLYMEITHISSLDEDEILVYKGSNNTYVKKVYAVTQTVYIYIICIVAPVGFMLARKEKIAHKRLNASDKLLLGGATGHLVFILFETVDFTEVIIGGRSDFVAVLFFIKLILKYQGVFAETMIVLITSKMEVRQDSIRDGRQLVIKGILVFLGTFNTERWFTDNFLPPNVLRYVEDISYNEMYGQTTWWFLTEFLYPFVMIFRLAMTIMCFETCVRLKRESLKTT